MRAELLHGCAFSGMLTKSLVCRLLTQDTKSMREHTGPAQIAARC